MRINSTLMKKIILLLLLLISSTIALFSQIDNRLAKGLVSIEQVAALPIPSQNTEALLADELSKRTSGRAPKYAVNIPVNFTPQAHGLWEDVKGDKMVSRMKIKSSGAEAINLGFTKYNMPRGGQLFLYSSDYQEVFGPFTPADNEEHEQLWTPNIKGDEIVIEIQIPKSEYNNLDIELGFVNHAFQKFSSAALLSGSCNLDVICGTADGWGIVEPHRDIIQSVAVISTGGGTFCTGFLISNANQDCTPLFMTADHCGIGAGNAASLVTYWNFFNSTCRQPNSAASGQNGDGTLADFNTGAIFRAGNSTSDFTIVELDDPVSETANAYFAGYDASGAQPSSAIGIHHPSTDEKRISFEDDPTQFTTYSSGTPTNNYTHVQVVDWDTGTTEGGSSGSPLFDQDERVIGQLHGGGAACGNNSSDWYGSLAVSWEGGGAPNTRLRDWLDPNNTGTLVNNGYYAGNCNFSVLADPGFQDVCPPANATYNLTVSDAFTSNVTLSTSGLAAGLNGSFSSNNVSPGSSVTLTISNTSNTTVGNYTFNVNATDGTNTSSNTLAINILPSAGSAPIYDAPNNGTAGLDPFPVLSWNGVAGVDYNIEIATDASFGNIIETATVSSSSYNSISTGDALTTYYWRVSANSPCGNGPFGAAWSFTTADITCVGINASNLDLAIGPNNGNSTTSVLNVPNDAIVSDVNVIGIDLAHSWINDLTIYLTSPSGQQIQLMDRICDDEDNLMMSFDDQSTNQFTNIPCPPTDGQSYQPFNNLSVFNGLNAQGNWTLTITDNANQDGGTLNAWNLQVCFEGETPPPNLVATAEVTENNECFNEEEGVIEITASEGTPPYTYSINGSPFQTEEVFEELGAGTYSVTAMDAAGMTVLINNLTVSQPPNVFATAIVDQDDVTIFANGGTAPYTYSIDGTNFQTGNTFNNLANGEYTAFVEDFNGCSVEENFTIEVNSITLSAQITQTMLCFNDNNAIITAIAGGGQEPYTFSITGGGSQNNGVFDNLAAGTYQITVQDNDGFSQMTAPIIINNPAQINATADVNGNDMTAMASGGTGALTYSIDGTNYQSNTQFLGLANGNYTLYVLDGNGCIETMDFIISINNLVVTATFERISCFNNADGIITVNASGGSAPYSYSLNGGTVQSSNTFSPLGPNTYEITVTDNDGFSQTSSPITLTNPAELSLAALVDEDEITAFGNGGTGNLLYSINNAPFQSINVFSNLSNGVYTITVIDENECIANQEVTIAVNNLTASAQASDISCNGNNDGGIFVSAGGGQEPYMYSLDGEIFQESQFFGGLSIGNYMITVQDADGFTQVTNTVSIAELNPITVTASTNENVITVSAVGGTGTFLYSIDGINFQDSNVFSGVDNGSYTVTVFDANECFANTTAIVAVNGLVASAQASDISCNGNNDGGIFVNAGGGQEPYMYSLDGEIFQESQFFDGLSIGNYMITVQDADGFTQVTNTVSIAEPTAITVTASTNENVITVSTVGGTGNFQYSIDGINFQESNVFSGVDNGSYTVTVFDANECLATTTAIVAVNGLVASAQASDISCNGNNDGGIFVSAGGGQEPYMYSLDGEIFQESQFFDGLSIGTYMITVQDADGFTQVTNTVSIAEPNPITVTASTNENVITVNAVGGTGNFQYSIDGINFQESNVFSGLDNGSYTITVFDANECFANTTAIVAVNGLVVSAQASDDISCNGNNDGGIFVNATGGQEPYMYSLDGEIFQESQFFNGLSIGTYMITVQDADGFTQVTNTVSIAEPTAITVTASTNENVITISAVGGTGNFLYSIDEINFQESNVFSGVDNGSYTITVFDANECFANTTAIISTDVLVISAEATNISCHDENDGTITTFIGGGQEPILYSIDGENFQDSPTFDNLPEGEYVVTAQDATGTSITSDAISIINPLELTITVDVEEDIIVAAGAGGILNYMYSIDGENYQESPIFNDVSNGTYTVYIIDANECINTVEVSVEVNNVSGTAAITSQISCFGDANGAINVSASGGSAPYQYSIDSGMTYQMDNFFGGLSADDYVFIILDNDGFTFTTEPITLSQPTELQANSSLSDNNITVMAEGGVTPYSYNINGGEFSTDNVFEDLVNGTYDIIIQDFNGCEVFLTETISINTMSISLDIENSISCFNEEDGSIVVNVMGGTAPFMYSIDGENFQESNVFMDLAAGSYSFTITDAQGALTETTAILLTNPEQLFISASTNENSASLIASGGSGNYLYSIDGETFQSSGEFFDLVNGDYLGYVQDANGCISETEFTILSVALFAVAEVLHNVDCFGDKVGVIEINASGGLAPYTYSLDGIEYFETNVFSELSAATYTCYAQDANGVIFQTETVTITEPELLILNAQGISSSIIASAEGGNAPYQFSIDGENFQDSGTFIDLPDGEYPVTVIDASGCTQDLTVIIDIVGTEDIVNNINFSIYPNPNTGTFSIELENSIRGDLSISLFNIIGQRLFEGTTTKDNEFFTFRVSGLDLPAGTYEVLVKGGDYVGMKKIVVVR